MINQIHMWQMAVDLGLVTSILIFAFRWMKSSRAQALLPKTLELEATLRSLITEADAAGRHLNEQLLRREQNLQRLLGDIEESEQKLTRAIAQSEERSKEIAIAVDNCRELIAELKESYLVEKDELRRHSKAAHRTERPAPQQAKVEPIPSAPVEEEEAAPVQHKPQQRAKPKTQPETQAPRSTADIQRVYAAAEILLKQGKKLEQVVAQTRLPAEEVQMLSQMIEVERDEQERQARESRQMKEGDPRLGALGSIRRQTTTL